MTPAELRNMQTDELQKEIRGKRLHNAKMQIEVRLGSQKDTAQFRRDKRELARLLTIVREKELKGEAQPQLKAKPKTRTMPVSAAAKPRKTASRSKAL